MSSRSGSRSPSDLAGTLLAVGTTIAAAAVLLAGCGMPAATGGATGPLYPDGPAFNHASHLEKGLECVDCHEGADGEAKVGMPEFDFCMECHEEMDEELPEEQRLSTLWLDDDGNPRWHNVTRQGGDIVFSHAPHHEAEIECSACHAGIEESERVSFALRQTMAQCMDCHAERGAPNACSTCHTDIGPDWKPPSHSRMWMTLHGQEVRRGGRPDGLEDDCAMCHTPTMCADCHRTQEPRDHSQAWRRGGGHGIAASLDRVRCQTCHEDHSCIACHETARPRSHRAGWGAPRARHCLGCHEPLRPGSPDGCGVCHDGAPSHLSAPPKPGWHTPDMECRLCHTPLRHADNGKSCNSCHR